MTYEVVTAAGDPIAAQFELESAIWLAVVHTSASGHGTHVRRGDVMVSLGGLAAQLKDGS
jgi:hypothetical protein